jgi:hypothetical protein
MLLHLQVKHYYEHLQNHLIPEINEAWSLVNNQVLNDINNRVPNPSRIIGTSARVARFCNDQIKYRHFFSQMQSRTVPFSSPFILDRMAFVPLPNSEVSCFKYMGRDMFLDVLDLFNQKLKEKSESWHICGCFGGGKTHILATVAVTLRMMRVEAISPHYFDPSNPNQSTFHDRSDTTFPRVIYVQRMLPSLFLSDFKTAVAYAFPELNISPMTHEEIIKLLEQQPYKTVLYIFDDWDNWENNESLSFAQTKRLTEQCGWSNQMRVYCISSPDQERNHPSMGEKLYLNSSLSEAEWNFWITQEPYQSLWQAIPSADREEFFSSLTDSQLS